MEELILKIMCIVGIGGSYGVIRGKSTVESVVYMVIVFINVGGMMVLMEADYMGMTVIMVYVGAIAVLFMFVVMLIGEEEERGEKRVLGKMWKGILQSVLIVIIMDMIWTRDDMLRDIQGKGVGKVLLGIDKMENIEKIGEVMYTGNVLNVLVSGGILLIGLIGAIALVKK